MVQTESSSVIQCGRIITNQDFDIIKQTVNLFPRLSRSELAATICEHLGWFTASGSCKLDACLKLLKKLGSQGLIALPEQRMQARPRRSHSSILWTARTQPKQDIVGTLRDVEPVMLEIAADKEAVGLWNEYMSRHHYLGYKRPFGFRLRYFIRCERGILGCILFAGAAKSLKLRDRWIGWTEQQRLRNLAWVINNARFLIFPWVRLRYLASHVLGQIARRIASDWRDRWGYRPVLLETFVDPHHYRGSCYRAANWPYLGMTTGQGLIREGRSYTTCAKKIFVKPLAKNFQSLLCSDQLAGRKAL